MFLSSKVAFIVPYKMTKGGMIDDIKSFVCAVDAQNNSETKFFCYGDIDDQREQFNNIDLIDMNSKISTYKELKKLQREDLVIFFTFSSVANVFWSFIVKLLFLRYSVIPSWQVHEFLDKDRPFPKNTIPTIESSEKKTDAFIFRKSTGVVEGNFTINSYFRSLKRYLYRKTLGKYFLNNASAIYTFSDFEKNNINNLIRLKNPIFLPIEFGTNILEKKIGMDKFSNKGSLNLLYWGRADFFYKGLDRIIMCIQDAKMKGIISPFKFWICGPDYNKGYSKILNLVQKLDLHNIVEIIPPQKYSSGTIGLLNDADFVITFSRWDGQARVLRESFALGKPIITNTETHFDRILLKTKTGLITNSMMELSDLLVNLNDKKINLIKERAINNQNENAEYISWSRCASRFLETIERI